MNVSPIRRGIVATAAMLSLGVGAAAHAGYSWSEILIPSIGPLGSAFGINDRDQVAVANLDDSKSGIYQRGIFTPLHTPPAGYSKISPTGINNSGSIVGGAFPPSDPTHEQGFLLKGSKYTFFARPGWANTEARAIASTGLVTGYNYDDTQTSFAGFVYDPATGVFTDATPPGSGAGFSVTQGMNAAGRIVGDGRSSELGRYAFVWQQGSPGQGQLASTPFLSRFKVGDVNVNTAARGINDAGIIVGFTAAGQGFVGSDSRGYELLIAPGGDGVGASTACEGINSFGQVVCEVTDAAGNNRAFIGTPGAGGP